MAGPDVFLCDAVRTPIGRYGGALAKVRADLAAQHIDARIQERVDAELKRVELRIELEEARDRSRADQAVHRDITIHTTEQPNGDRTEERTETDGK